MFHITNLPFGKQYSIQLKYCVPLREVHSFKCPLINIIIGFIYCLMPVKKNSAIVFYADSYLQCLPAMEKSRVHGGSEMDNLYVL